MENDLTRSVFINSISVAGVSFLMESMINPWGEDDQVVDAVIGNRFDEGVSLNIWAELIKNSEPGSLFLDVGAYTGIYSLAAASIRPDIKCVAFEPSTITFGRLAKNILLNGFDTRVIPANLAVASQSSHIRFPHRFGIYSLCSGESSESKEYDHTQPAVTMPLDDLLNDTIAQPYLDSMSTPVWPYKRIVAMKVDVEGVEIDVLMGARKLIAEHSPAIIAEYLSDQAFDQLKDFAVSQNYQIFKIPNERNALLAPGRQIAQTVDKAASKSGGTTGFRKWTFSVPL